MKSAVIGSDLTTGIDGTRMKRAIYQQQVMAIKADDGVETVSLNVAESSMPYANLHRLHQRLMEFSLHCDSSSAALVNGVLRA